MHGSESADEAPEGVMILQELNTKQRAILEMKSSKKHSTKNVHVKS